MRRRTAMALVSLAAMSTFTGVVASTAQAAPGLGADCAVLGPVASGAVGNLTPLQSLPRDQAQTRKDQYVAQLRAKEANLQTAQGRNDLNAYINAVNNASSPSAGQAVLNTIVQLQNDCP